jgi:hypothetical protein
MLSEYDVLCEYSVKTFETERIKQRKYTGRKAVGVTLNVTGGRVQI